MDFGNFAGQAAQYDAWSTGMDASAGSDGMLGASSGGGAEGWDSQPQFQQDASAPQDAPTDYVPMDVSGFAFGEQGDNQASMSYPSTGLGFAGRPSESSWGAGGSWSTPEGSWGAGGAMPTQNGDAWGAAGSMSSPGGMAGIGGNSWSAADSMSSPDRMPGLGSGSWSAGDSMSSPNGMAGKGRRESFDASMPRRDGPVRFVSAGAVESPSPAGSAAAELQQSMAKLEKSMSSRSGEASNEDDEDLLAPGISQAFGGPQQLQQAPQRGKGKPHWAAAREWREQRPEGMQNAAESWALPGAPETASGWGQELPSDANAGQQPPQQAGGMAWQGGPPGKGSPGSFPGQPGSFSGPPGGCARPPFGGGFPCAPSSGSSAGSPRSGGCPHWLRGEPGAPRPPPETPRGRLRNGEAAPGNRLSVLMLAEKPAIAQAFAAAAAPAGRYQKENRGSLPTFCFTGPWIGGGGPGPPCVRPDSMCEYRITSSIGHVYSLDFPHQMRNWSRFDPEDLFDAGPVRNETNADAKLPQHFADEAARCHVVVLCLDCDREGEAIGYEALESVIPNLARHPHIPIEDSNGDNYQGRSFANDPRVWRVHFSSLAQTDLRVAMKSLIKPNPLEARAVDARAEIDLKVGVALSRLITLNLRNEVGELAPEREGEGKKHGALLSYGPCQTPTLGFCVERWDMIQNFHKQVSNTLDLRVRSPSGAIVTLAWQPPRNLITTDDTQQEKGKGKGKKGKGGFQEAGSNRREVLEEFVQKINNADPTAEAECLSIDSFEQRVERPVALNTVELLRLSSRELGIDPQRALSVAEKLYLSGFTTYPRTETTRYSPSVDFHEVVNEHSNHKSWGKWCKFLLNGQITDPREGADAGDHPPITPVWCASEDDIKRKTGAMARDAVRVYELITKNFLASVSPDVQFTRHEAAFDLDGFKFTLRGNEVTDWGFARLHQGFVRSAQNGWMLTQRNLLKPLRLGLVQVLEPGMRLKVAGISIRELVSTPPKLLTEAELLSLMEKDGIGTDASMATHVSNVVNRGYVEAVGEDRRMRPTILGVWLVHGLQAIDGELTQPQVRARIERDVNSVANGHKTCEHVVGEALVIFRNKFHAVRNGIPVLKEVLEKTREQKDSWSERPAEQKAKKVEEPPDDEEGVVVGPPALSAKEVARAPAKRARDEPAAAAPAAKRAKTSAGLASSSSAPSTGGGSSSKAKSAKATKPAVELTGVAKVRAENKLLKTKLAIAELRAENAELKWREMDRKHDEMEARVRKLQLSEENSKSRGGHLRGRGR